MYVSGWWGECRNCDKCEVGVSLPENGCKVQLPQLAETCMSRAVGVNVRIVINARWVGSLPENGCCITHFTQHEEVG